VGGGERHRDNFHLKGYNRTMPITTKRWTNDPAHTTTNVAHAGRVLRVEHRQESRNHSETADFSDWRTVMCTYAVVWLGERGIPGGHWWRPDLERELDIHEQITRIDCTNLFGWMDSSTVSVEVDTDIDPRAEVALLTWEAFEKARVEASRRAAEAEAARHAEEVKKAAAAKAAREAKKQAKLTATAVVAEVELAKVQPLKGKVVTLKSGFQGTLFWAGIKAYRGVNSARIGVRTSKGDVEWAAASDIVTTSI
jgi:hypothetical protein